MKQLNFLDVDSVEKQYGSLLEKIKEIVQCVKTVDGVLMKVVKELV